MKKLLLIILGCLPFFIYCQRPALSILPEVEGIPTYSEVVKVDSSASQQELHNRAKIWFVNNYKSANNVLQMEDKEAGVLIGKGFIPLEFHIKVNGDSSIYEQNINVYHSIKVYTKKGKYKFEVSDLVGKSNDRRLPDLLLVNGDYGGLGYVQEQILYQTDAAILKTIASLKAAMNKPVAAKIFKI